MIVAIHQPNFLPWLGFFYKWAHSDVFVLLDDVQFIKRNIINRVKIKALEGTRWLTIPVQTKGQYLQLIRDVKIDQKGHWQKKMLGTISACYGQARFFYNHYQELETILLQKNEYLVDLNINLLAWLAAKFSISTPIRRSSELTGISGVSTERLVSICHTLGATVYLSGQGGEKYQDVKMFNQNEIQLQITDFQHPVYPQAWGAFIPGLSGLDFLMNCGDGSTAQKIIT